jgi:hypothetical protein
MFVSNETGVQWDERMLSGPVYVYVEKIIIYFLYVHRVCSDTGRGYYL